MSDTLQTTLLGPPPCAPDDAYLRLATLDPRFLLESAGPASPTAGRWSLLGLGQRRRVRLVGEVLEVDGQERILAPGPGPLLAALRELLADTPLLGGGPVPFRGGLVGAFGYDIVRRFEPRLERGRRSGPAADLELLAPAAVLAFDHHRGSLSLLGDPGLAPEIQRLLRTPSPAPRGGRSSTPTASFSDAAFLDAVRQAQEHIRAGDVFQLVLSLRLQGETELAPFEVYQVLRRLNPSPYLYFLDLGHSQVVGSSPEALVRLRDGQAFLRPIAGTRPRGASADLDQALEAELQADPKEAAEHVMLVDLARNDMGRVAAPGSVRVDPFRVIERYSHVMHIVSGVGGKLAADRDALDLLAATFPAGTVSGAPKIRALELIDALEPVPRGLYSGTVGWLGAQGDLDQAIAIRTMVFRDGRYAVQAGAGIVARSVPELELAEVRAKARALLVALEEAGRPLRRVGGAA